MRNPFRDLFVGNDTRITFGQRNKDQYTAAMDISRDAAVDELLHGDAVSNRAPRSVRHQCNPHSRNAKYHQKSDKYDGLHGQDSEDWHRGEDHQRPGVTSAATAAMNTGRTVACEDMG